MQRWTRIGEFALTDDRFETQAVRGSNARAMLGLIRGDSIEAQDLRRFLWELGYYDVHRMSQEQVLSALEHCLSTGAVGVVPWVRMREILFAPGNAGGGAERGADAGGGVRPVAPSRGSTKPSTPPPREMRAPVERAEERAKPERQDTRLNNSKAVMPKSLAEAVAQLAMRREEIALHDYRPKYTDQELLAMARRGDVASERFQVRFMEKGYLQHRNTPTVPLSGAMGAPLEGVTGKGAKYWSTSFDQIEDADTDQKLICAKLGIPYKPEAEYALIIVDMKKAAPLTGVKSVPATFEKVGEFAYTERPQNFTKAFTDEVMTPTFQAKYAKYYKDAVTSGKIDERKLSVEDFEGYLKTIDLPEIEIKTLKKRMQMHTIIGNNQEYLGNGVTKDLIQKSPNKFGAVETLNFERREVNLQELQKAGAITVLTSLTPLPVKPR